MQNLSAPASHQIDNSTGLHASVQPPGSAVSPAVADVAHLEQTGLPATLGENDKTLPSMAGGLGGSAASIGESGFYYPAFAGITTVTGLSATQGEKNGTSSSMAGRLGGSAASVGESGFYYPAIAGNPTVTGTTATSQALTDVPLPIVDSAPEAQQLERIGLPAAQCDNEGTLSSVAGGLGGSAAGIGERGFYFPTNVGNLTVHGMQAAGSGANVQTPGFTYTGMATSPALTDASLLVGVDSAPAARQLEQIGPPAPQGDNDGVSSMFGGSHATRHGDNDVNEDAILDEPALDEEIENQAPAVEPEADVIAVADLQQPEEDEQPVAVAPLRRRSTRSCHKPDRLRMS